MSVSYDHSLTLLLYCPCKHSSLLACGLNEWERICNFVCRLFIQVLSLEIQLSRGGWNPIKWLNPPYFLCLSQYKSWISNVLIRSRSWGDRWLFAFVDIGGIADPHYLDFLLIMNSYCQLFLKHVLCTTLYMYVLMTNTG